MKNVADLKILILGFGVSGKGAYDYLHKKVKKLYVINRGEPKDWMPKEGKAQFLCQETFVASEIEALDYVLLSPGISRQKAWDLVQNISEMTHEKLISDVELFSLLFDGDIIAITGTNGKTTTVSLLRTILEEDHRKLFTGGNIGTPVLHGLLGDYDLALLELSSFQLESCFSLKPKAAAILNVKQNHGERYEQFEDYERAKQRIFQNMNIESDLCLFPKGYKGKSIPSEEDLLNELEPFIPHYHLLGRHNLENLWVAIQMAEFLGVSKEIIVSAIKKFKGVSFRCQKIYSSESLVIYNDAKSTNWDATISALKSLESLKDNSLKTLIIGGQLRGHGDEPPRELLDSYKQGKVQIILTGQSGQWLKQYLKKALYYPNLKDLLSSINYKQKKMTILFSPAFPSFDQYKNYVQRGEAFNELVEHIFKDKD